MAKVRRSSYSRRELELLQNFPDARAGYFHERMQQVGFEDIDMQIIGNGV